MMKLNNIIIYSLICSFGLSSINTYALDEPVKFTIEEEEFEAFRTSTAIDGIGIDTADRENLNVPGMFDFYEIVPSAWFNPMKGMSCWFWSCWILQRLTENIRIEGLVERTDRTKPFVVIADVFYYSWYYHEVVDKIRYHLIHTTSEGRFVDDGISKIRFPTTKLPPIKIRLYIQNGTPVELNIGKNY